MGARVKIEIDERTLRMLVLGYLSEKVGVQLAEKDVQIETKSAQNYRSEWERASFRARVDKEIT